MLLAASVALDDLRSAIMSLGDGGGWLSPSIYDTAQMLRYCPPASGVEPALEWLLGQQYRDGGWGEPSGPAARDVSTLATVLALYTLGHGDRARAAVAAGLEFLREHAAQWMDINVDEVPVAAEMIVPVLLDDARAHGLDIDPAPYARLFDMHHQKRHLLAKVGLKANTAPIFSWEALRQPFQPVVLDPLYGVGHSPAATAAWLAAGRALGADPALLAKAEAYLERASAATGMGIPGVVPVAYPITGIELSYGLYPLLLTGVLNLPALQDVVQPKLDQLQAILERHGGLGFGETFVADVDDTGVAMAVLCAAGRHVNLDFLHHFWQRDHFYTYGHEINPSVFSNIHALHALAQYGEPCVETEEFLLHRQQPTGHWLPDKWHTSWRCVTMEAIIALGHFGHQGAVETACRALLEDQNGDGGWGNGSSSSILETVYGIIGLRHCMTGACQPEETCAALTRAEQWLGAHYTAFDDSELRWTCKETFSPVRVDHTYLLSTVLTSAGFALAGSTTAHASVRVAAD